MGVERLFVDYADDTTPVFDQITDTKLPPTSSSPRSRAAQYTYAEAR
jgi:hypothetical protein